MISLSYSLSTMLSRAVSQSFRFVAYSCRYSPDPSTSADRAGLALLDDLPPGVTFQGEIVCRILRGTEEARPCAIATLGDQRQRTATAAITWIRANYATPLRILTAMSPLPYQKQIRLQAACSPVVAPPVAPPVESLAAR
jgi:hypothetical protein